MPEPPWYLFGLLVPVHALNADVQISDIQAPHLGRMHHQEDEAAYCKSNKGPTTVAWRRLSPSTGTDVRNSGTLAILDVTAHWAAGSHSVNIKDVSVKKIFHVCLFVFKNEGF